MPSKVNVIMFWSAGYRAVVIDKQNMTKWLTAPYQLGTVYVCRKSSMQLTRRPGPAPTVAGTPRNSRCLEFDIPLSITGNQSHLPPLNPRTSTMPNYPESFSIVQQYKQRF